MRWIAALAMLGATAACANMGSPPGGPLRTTPPELLDITPDSGAVNVRPRNVEFQFDEVLSDRGSGSSGSLDRFFIVSPNEGLPRVRWRRSRIEVRPRRGFLPNTAYSVTMLPGLTDLRGNVLKTGRTIVFSTGPRIPGFSVMGRVFDWMNERIAPNALVEVIRRPDSLPYVGIADSTGQFAVGPLEEGSYTVRAIMDVNNNRALDPNESWDSVAVVVRGNSPFLELLAAQRDTVAPKLLTVTTPDTLTLIAIFDRPLDPAATLTPASFRVVGADSVRLTVASVLTSREAAAQKARADSIARRDSARTDTLRRGDTTRAAPVARPPLARPRPGARPAAPVVDLKPSQPQPAREVTIRLDSLTPMRSGRSYRVTAMNARGLLKTTRTSDRVATTAAAAAARPDSAAAGRRP